MGMKTRKQFSQARITNKADHSKKGDRLLFDSVL
jgi:hypothetical protein